MNPYSTPDYQSPCKKPHYFNIIFFIVYAITIAVLTFKVYLTARLDNPYLLVIFGLNFFAGFMCGLINTESVDDEF